MGAHPALVEASGVPVEELPPDCPGPFRLLIAMLQSTGVRFCHWKSNIRLGDGLSGRDDLDLLVHRADAADFGVALLKAGFKPARSTADIGHPGVLHAFALDAAGGRLLHVHAYLQVVTGDSLVKSYRLPIENTLLSRTRTRLGIPIPLPEVELALFALRAALKHTTPAEIAMVSRGYGAIVRELAWLEAAAERDVARRQWCDLVPNVEPDLFDAVLSAIADPKALRRRILLGRTLAHGLSSMRRLRPLPSMFSRWRRIGHMALGRMRHRRDLTLETGGLIVAIVGPKATGKSTLASALERLLGSHLDVRRVHCGKPPPTALSFAPRLLVPLARVLFPRERPAEYEKPERRSEARQSLLYVLRMTLLAYDRRALVRRCWRAAAAGSVVVTDRYPSETIGAIDSRCFDDETIDRCSSRLKRWLMRRERALCSGLPQPELVIRLVAPVSTAVRRDATRMKEGGPDAEAVLRRRQMETLSDFGPAPVVSINTDRALEETVSEVARVVWAAL